jgi:hypothetical protein
MRERIEDTYGNQKPKEKRTKGQTFYMKYMEKYFSAERLLTYKCRKIKLLMKCH